MNLIARNEPKASYSAKRLRGPANALSRRARAMRESLSLEHGAAPNDDLMKPMGEILREEEAR